MSMLLRLFVGILATAAVTGMARAADLPLPTKAPPAPLYDWTGFYVGGNVGYGWGHTDVTGSSSSVLLGVATPSTFAGGLNSSGVLGGGQIGFNYQFAPHWVAGIEADIDGAGINGSTNTCSATTAGVAVGCDTAALKLTDFGTVRGHLGYAWNNMLLFGTGGIRLGPEFDRIPAPALVPAVQQPRCRSCRTVHRRRQPSPAGPREPVRNGASFQTGHCGSNICTSDSMT